MANIQDKAIQVMVSNPTFLVNALGDTAVRKAVIIYETELGLTAKQISIKYDLNLNTVKSIVLRCKAHR